MELRLDRKWFTIASTIGELYVDDRYECFMLEDPVRERDVDQDGDIDAADVVGFKIQDRTAIPSGRYQVILWQSPKFGEVLKLLDVPGYTDILAHAGNRAVDTKGCLLTGQQRGENAVYNSRVALAALLLKVKAALARNEEVWISVSNVRETTT